MKYILNPTPEGTTFRVIICGAEGFCHWKFLVEWTDRWLQHKVDSGIPIEIVYRRCIPYEDSAKVIPTLDQLVLRYATERGYISTAVGTSPSAYGQAAGPLQSLAMLEYGYALIVFHDNKDRAIKKMMQLARKYGIPIRDGLFNYKFKSNLLHA